MMVDRTYGRDSLECAASSCRPPYYGKLPRKSPFFHSVSFKESDMKIEDIASSRDWYNARGMVSMKSRSDTSSFRLSQMADRYLNPSRTHTSYERIYQDYCFASGHVRVTFESKKSIWISREHPISMRETIIKVTSYFLTLFILPLLALYVKVVYRKNVVNPFEKKIVYPDLVFTHSGGCYNYQLSGITYQIKNGVSSSHGPFQDNLKPWRAWLEATHLIEKGGELLNPQTDERKILNAIAGLSEEEKERIKSDSQINPFLTEYFSNRTRLHIRPEK